MDPQALLTLGIILLTAGLLLLFADLFVPSGGILLMLSMGVMAVGIVLPFRHSTTAGVSGVAGVFVVLPLLFALLIKFWPHTPLARMMRPPPDEAEALPMHQELQYLKGRTGRTLSALKPGGMVDFDGRRVDCITEGMMLEAGRTVRCVEVRGGTVVVRAADGVGPSDLETAIFS